MEGRVSVFPLVPPDDLPAQLLRHGVHAVADPEHWNPAFEHVAWSEGGSRVIDTGRAAGKDEALGTECGDLGPWGVVGHYFAVYLALAHPPGDEHAVLGAKVEDDDSVTLGAGGRSLLRDGMLTAFLLGDLEVGR
jgi:hypothetical protein